MNYPKWYLSAGCSLLRLACTEAESWVANHFSRPVKPSTALKRFCEQRIYRGMSWEAWLVDDMLRYTRASHRAQALLSLNIKLPTYFQGFIDKGVPIRCSYGHWDAIRELSLNDLLRLARALEKLWKAFPGTFIPR